MIHFDTSYLVRWSLGCDEHLCKECDVDCLDHEAWLDQSDLTEVNGRRCEILDYCEFV